jgi:hypothetical protein
VEEEAKEKENIMKEPPYHYNGSRTPEILFGQEQGSFVGSLDSE